MVAQIADHDACCAAETRPAISTKLIPVLTCVALFAEGAPGFRRSDLADGVPRAALASVAGMILSTDALVTDLAEGHPIGAGPGAERIYD